MDLSLPVVVHLIVLYISPLRLFHLVNHKPVIVLSIALATPSVSIHFIDVSGMLAELNHLLYFTGMTPATCR